MEAIELRLSCSYTTAVEPTRRVCEVASMFGLGVDRQRTIAVVSPVSLPIVGGSVVFVTGASGGGKSTLLRLIGEQLRERGDVRVVEFGGRDVRDHGLTEDGHAVLGQEHDRRETSSGCIVEAMGGTLEQATRWLAMAGLNDAFVMLRKESELSDGQRYRLALARAMAEAERAVEGEGLTVVLADEFGSTLDRLTAKVVARNVRKWVSRSVGRVGIEGEADRMCGGGVCFVAATTHDDLLEYLEPEVLVVQEPGEGIGVHCRERNDE